MVGLYSPVSDYSLVSLMKDRFSPQPHRPYTLPLSSSRTAPKRQVPFRKLRKGQRVVVREELDGLYYPGQQGKREFAVHECQIRPAPFHSSLQASLRITRTKVVW